MRRYVSTIFFALVIACFIIVSPTFAQTPSLADQVRGLTHHAEEGREASEQGNLVLMRAEYQEIEAIWSGFEDQVREHDPKGYADLESALGAIGTALDATPFDAHQVQAAYEQLAHAAQESADRLPTTAIVAPPTTNVAQQVRGLTNHAQEGMAAAEQGNLVLMRAEYQEIEAIWSGFEDQVREQNPKGYIELEGALASIQAALSGQTIDPAAVHLAYEHLEDEAQTIANQLGGASTPSVQTEATPASMLQLLESASTQIERGNGVQATKELEHFLQAWPGVEGAIAAKSQDAYTTIEIELGRAMAALRAQPADLHQAAASIERLHQALAPFAIVSAYTALDAAAIILREGLEALLVLVALLAFLSRSGNAEKRRWIWVGGVLGVIASIITALLLQAIFSHVIAGQNRELIEGITGLIAAALLFYVSYWMHSKASLYAWQSYVNSRTTRALAQGSVFGLALLAFLAVFREGAETTVFYLGMAPSIALQDLILGLGMGIFILSIVAVLILVVGVRLPMRPFFRIAGLLVYYLGFKFVGTGIHALQVVGIVSPSTITGMSPVPFFGIYPTWETVLPQLMLLVGAAAVFLYLRARERRFAMAAVAA